MRVKKFICLLYALVLSVNLSAQTKSGLLAGVGMGFEKLSMDEMNADYEKGVRFDDIYNYNLHLGYRFRFEPSRKLFFDIDPLMKLQALKSWDYYPPIKTNPYASATVIARNVNFQLAVSSTFNLRLTEQFYIGVGVEPTLNIVTDGKPFDIPVLGRVGFDLGKVDVAVTYRQGFMNVVHDQKYKIGRTSDVNVSLFIPFNI